MDQRKILSAQEMEQYKRELATYQMLRKEIDFKQAAELLNSYLNEWGTSKLAEKWGIKNHNIYELRKTIRQQLGEDALQPIPRGKGRKSGPKTGKAKIQKKEAAAEKKSVALTIFEDRIQELEKQVAEQQAQLEEKDRVLEEAHAHAVAPVAEDVKAMIELVQEQSEQIAAAVQAVQQQQPTDLAGIALTFEGEFSADTLKKRLGKVIAMIEGEPSTFDVTFHVIEKPRIDVTPTEGEAAAEPVEADIPEEVQKAVEQTEALQKQLDDLTMNFLTWEEEMKAIKEQTAVAVKWGNGYTALQTDKKGLHHPKSEFEGAAAADESKIPERSVITRHGIKCYQSYYVCSKCGDRGKTFTPKGSEYVNCKRCGEGMEKRDATEKGFPNVDSYGNVYIAGEYVQEKA